MSNGHDFKKLGEIAELLERGYRVCPKCGTGWNNPEIAVCPSCQDKTAVRDEPRCRCGHLAEHHHVIAGCMALTCPCSTFEPSCEAPAPVTQPSAFILCEECEGRGWFEEDGKQHSCPVCDGEPKITFATVKDYAEQIDSLLNEKMKLPSEMQVAKLVVWAQDAAVILTVAKDEGIRISRLDQTVASADAALAPWRER